MGVRHLPSVAPASVTPPPAPARSRSRRAGWAAVKWGFALLVVVFLVRVAADNVDALRDTSLELRPLWLLASAPLVAGGSLLLPLAWRHLVAAYGPRLRKRDAMRIWFVSQASRFIPSGMATVASRVVLAHREGVPRSLAGASVLVEGGIILLLGGLVAGVFLPSSLAPAPIRLLLVAGCAGALLALPWVLAIGGRLVSRLPALAPDDLDLRQLYEAVAIYATNTVAKSLGFLFLAASILPLSATDAPLVIGAINGAVVIGMLGITPGGLGVREGVLAALLAHRFSLGDAAAFAVAMRAWDFAFELIWLSAAAVAGRRRDREREDALAAGAGAGAGPPHPDAALSGPRTSPSGLERPESAG